MTVEMADESEVAPEGPQPTHIDVHVHQESSLAQLLQAGCALLRLPGPALGTPPQPWGSSRLLVASWVVQIVLGFLSGVLGGFLYIPWNPMRSSGAAIWTGVVAVLAGTTAFLHEKRGGICWALLRTFLLLATFSTAIPAIGIGSSTVEYYHYYDIDDFCKASSGHWPTEPPSTPNPQEVKRLHLCNAYLSMMKALVISLCAMLLGVWVLLLLASLAPVCLYCFAKKKGDRKLLLEANGP